jgi:hypothetical protein
VDDFLLMTFSESSYDLFQDGDCLFFRDFFIFVNLISQSTLITILDDHYFDIFVLEAFITFEDIRTVYPHHESRLLMDQSLFDDFLFFVIFFKNFPNINHLNSHYIVVV